MTDPTRWPQLPFEHYIGVLSQEFGGALPSQLMREIGRLPSGFLEQVVEYRRYAEMKRMYDPANAEQIAKLQQTTLGALLVDIDMEMAAE